MRSLSFLPQAQPAIEAGVAPIGTLAWLEESQGKLSLFEEVRVVLRGVLVRARAQRSRAAKVRLREVDEIRVPDTKAALAAIALCKQASSPALYEHCMRAYFWALLLDRGGPFDAEALLVACALHDLGLTESHRLRGASPACFTKVGADAALGLATAHGWTDARARAAAEAIALHLNVVVGAEQGREAQLLRLGSGADVAGLGIKALHGDQIEAVLARHPRRGLKRAVGEALAREASERPRSRIGFLVRRLDFGGLVARAPFAE
jgi:hypothetical protein